MLETIHAYALELLGDGEAADALRRRHTDYFVALAERIAELGRSSLNIDWPVFERELDNFRAALDRLEAAGECELAVRLVAALSDLWSTTGRHGEASRWLEWALGIDDVSPSLQARIKLGASGVAWRSHELDLARDLAQQALALFRELDDRIRVAWTLGSLGIIASIAGNFSESDAFAEEALDIFRELRLDRGVVIQTHNRALAAIAEGDYVRARPLLEQSLAGAERLESDQNAGNALCDLGILDLYERRYEDAAPLFFARALESALENRLAHQRRVLIAGPRSHGGGRRGSRAGGATVGRLGCDRRGDRRADSRLRGAHLRADRRSRAQSPGRAADRHRLQRRQGDEPGRRRRLRARDGAGAGAALDFTHVRGRARRAAAPRTSAARSPPTSSGASRTSRASRFQWKDYWEFDRLVTVSDPRGVADLDALDAIYHWTELIQSSPLAVERSVHAAIGGAYRSQGITTLELPLQSDEAESRRRARPRPHHPRGYPRARPRAARVFRRSAQGSQFVFFFFFFFFFFFLCCCFWGGGGGVSLQRIANGRTHPDVTK